MSARDDFTKGDFSSAEKKLLDPKIINDEKGRLLTLLDLGLTAHYSGNFEKSNIFLFKAKQIARELYTASTVEDAASLLFSDNAKTYPGMEYEISLLHYYTTLNFLLLSQADKIPKWEILEVKDGNEVRLPGEVHEERALSNQDRAKFRSQSRSELLAWNAFLNEVRQRNRGEPYYKDDLLNKIFASYVHESIDTSEDRNIARILLKDADKLMTRAYSAYPSFNKKWEDYVKDYSKFETLGETAVGQQYIDATPIYNVTKDEISKDAKKGNAFFLVEWEEVPVKKEKDYVIGFSTLMKNISDPYLRRQVEELGMRVLIEMAPKFGLMFFSSAVVGSASDDPKFLSEAVDSAIGFKFRLPVIESEPFTKSAALHFVKDGEDKQFPLALLSPLGDIAKLNVNRRANSIALRTGVRVGLKYMAALMPAIATYKRMESSPEFLRMAAANGVWMVGKKVADASEAPDLRGWELLPFAISGAKVSLPIGNYSVSIQDGDKKFDLGEVNLTKEDRTLRARIFSSGKIVVN
jgi:hypothetical protein